MATTFTEFLCDPVSGANVNAGDNKTLATQANGAYTQGGGAGGNDLYVAAAGTPFAASVAGDFVSIYNDGATVTTFIGRITAVNSSTSIDISLTAKAGTRPSTVGSGKTATVGGKWAGPNGANNFPIGSQALTGSVALTNVAGNFPRFNFLATATYAVTAAMSTSAAITGVVVQGCATTAGDLGKATIDGGQTGASYTVLTLVTATACEFIDLIFAHNGATGVANGVSTTAAFANFRRCTFTGMMGAGLFVNENRHKVYDCLAYACNLANTAGVGAFTNNTGCVYTNCRAYNNGGANTAGFAGAGSTGSTTFEKCIAHLCTFGFLYQGSSVCSWESCDTYNNSSDGISIQGVNGTFYVRNSNLVKNGGWGINGASGGTNMAGAIENCGFGSGTMANTSGTINSVKSMQETGSVTYASGVTPWSAPDTGDFRIALQAARNAGKGTFTETQTGYTGTIGYPDIGAAQHIDYGTSAIAVTSGLTVSIDRGQDLQLVFALATTSDMTGWTVRFRLSYALGQVATLEKTNSTTAIVLDNTAKTATVSFARADTLSLLPVTYAYEVARTNSGFETVLNEGDLVLKARPGT